MNAGDVADSDIKLNLTTVVPLGGQLSSGSCCEIFREKISIVIHRNIRCFLPLMVNLECRCRINFPQGQAAGPASETNDE
jgi:hypothetical protein